MPRATANGIEIEYDEIGSASDPAILLIMGFSGQMTRWPAAFKRGLADAGRRVIWFDNRDIGLSTEFADHVPPPPQKIIEHVMSGGSAASLVPYVLDDMAADTAGLLDALDIGAADVLGVSMGGMIAQLMALNHPGRVRRLVPVMTTSGDPSLPPGTPEAIAALTTPPAERTVDAVVETALTAQRAIGSDPAIRNDAAQIRERVAADFHRSDRPMGVARQYAAILAQPRWHDRLSDIGQPTLVLHGAVDPLIRPACGEDIAKRVPNAQFKSFDQWGHDIPEKMVAPLLDELIPFLDADQKCASTSGEFWRRRSCAARSGLAPLRARRMLSPLRRATLATGGGGSTCPCATPTRVGTIMRIFGSWSDRMDRCSVNGSSPIPMFTNNPSHDPPPSTFQATSRLSSSAPATASMGSAARRSRWSLSGDLPGLARLDVA